MPDYYSVKIEDFAESHYIKSFCRKYKDKWDITLTAISAQLSRIDNLLLTDKADTIVDAKDIKIIKTEFKIAGSQDSAKTSGNRCIVAWHTEEKIVYILLVYGKTDLSGRNETAEWQNIIKTHYPKYKYLF